MFWSNDRESAEAGFLRPNVRDCDGLSKLEKRLAREQINALIAMAEQPHGVSISPVELSRVADICTVLQAVRSELAARLPHEGWS
jgi:hypothetical protein